MKMELTPRMEGILAGLADRKYDETRNPYNHYTESNQGFQWREGYQLGRQLLDSNERFRAFYPLPTNV